MPSAEITSYKPTRRELLKLLADSVHFGLDPYIAIWQYSHMAMNIHADRLSLTFAALADPTRRAILARLALGNADVSRAYEAVRLNSADDL